MSIREALEDVAVKSTFAQANADGVLLQGAVARAADPKRQRAAMQAMGWGVVTAGVYAAVFMNAEAIMDLTKQGAAMAAIPLALAFVVSYVHGNFTGAFWTAMGIDASKKTKKTADVQPQVRKDTRPRAQLRA